MKQTLRIGTRGSQLALAQSGMVGRWIEAAAPSVQVELVVIKTAGDRFVDRPLSAIGGKGLFVKEIEEALSAQSVDAAVHSMKDVPGELAAGLVLSATPERADPRDVFISRLAASIAELPQGARVGTSSLRRMALLRAQRPDLQILPLRGNVDSRLRKLEAGEYAAIILAAAGLQRLGLQRDDTYALAPATFLPAVGQGVLAIETRPDWAADVVHALNHEATAQAVAAERAFLLGVGGSCRTPLAAYATVDDGALKIDALIASVDGKTILHAQRNGAPADGPRLGADLASELLGRGGRAIIADLEANGG